MGNATDKFLAAIRKSHEMLAFCDAISPTQEKLRLIITEGEVTVDRTAQYRRAARIVCIDPEGVFAPNGPSGILTPFGTEIRPYRGITYDDGTSEVYPLGVFRLAKTTIVESTTTNVGVVFTLEMYDRSRTVSRDKFTTPYVVDEGTNIIDAIKAILSRTFPDLTYDAISTSLTTSAPQVFDVSNDPWEAVTTLASSLGCEIYFNTEGWVVIAPPTDIDALPSPDFTYIEGQDCIMTDLESDYSDEPGFNGVVVTGESVGDELPPVRAEAWDEEPSSPTYRKGPYGEVPMFVQDSNVKTTDDAQSVADSLLKGQLGFSSQLTVTGVVNPTYEAGDVVQVERSSLHITGLYTVDAFNVPLKRDLAQSVVVRQKRKVG